MGEITWVGFMIFYLAIALVGGICAINIIRAINRLGKSVDGIYCLLKEKDGR